MHNDLKPKQFNLNSWLNILQLIVLVGGGGIYIGQQNKQNQTSTELLKEHGQKIDALDKQVSRMEGEMSRFIRMGQ